jgi:hypothetical protein
MFSLFPENSFGGLLFLNLDPRDRPRHHFQDSIVKPGFSNSRLSLIFLRRVMLGRGKTNLPPSPLPPNGGEGGVMGKG